MGRPKVGGPNCWGLKGGQKKSCFFFPSLAPIFICCPLSGDLLVSFFHSLGVFSWNFGGVLVGRETQMRLFSPSGGPAEGGPGQRAVRGGGEGGGHGGVRLPKSTRPHQKSAKPRRVAKVGPKSAWPDQNRPKLAKLKAVAKVSRGQSRLKGQAKLIEPRLRLPLVDSAVSTLLCRIWPNGMGRQRQ